ncbi:MAG: Crp/Fnr family transcriptional regulator [Chloroflexota bacterium]
MFSYPDQEGRPTAGFLATLDEQEIATLLRYTQARRYAPGELAIHEGDTDRGLYLVTAGRFEVLVPGQRGMLRATFMEPGDIVGELAFFDGQPRAADVRAVIASEALVLTPAGFQRLRVNEPRLALNVVLDLGRALSTRFRAYNRRLAALGKL